MTASPTAPRLNPVTPLFEILPWLPAVYRIQFKGIKVVSDLASCLTTSSIRVPIWRPRALHRFPPLCLYSGSSLHWIACRSITSTCTPCSQLEGTCGVCTASVQLSPILDTINSLLFSLQCILPAPPPPSPRPMDDSVTVFVYNFAAPVILSFWLT